MHRVAAPERGVAVDPVHVAVRLRARVVRARTDAQEGVAHELRHAGPLRGLRGQAARDKVARRSRHPRRHVQRVNRRPSSWRPLARVGEGHLPGQHLVQQAPHRPHVHRGGVRWARAVLLALARVRLERAQQHLGRHVGRGARARVGALARQVHRHAKVDELEAAPRVKHHVLWLDVAVHHALRVQVLQCGQQRAHDARRRLGLAQLAASAKHGLQQVAARRHLLHDGHQPPLMAQPAARRVGLGVAGGGARAGAGGATALGAAAPALLRGQPPAVQRVGGAQVVCGGAAAGALIRHHLHLGEHGQQADDVRVPVRRAVQPHLARELRAAHGAQGRVVVQLERHARTAQPALGLPHHCCAAFVHEVQRVKLAESP
mmetsp:Transcript_5352/g.13204  ORF Transcript_5352/g.13204 Transcript_5352/m.13204 type:complete len:375 (-) Transcript_5352:369-1493(-)